MRTKNKLKQMKTKILFGIITFVCAFLYLGCSLKNDDEELQKEEQQKLKKYIAEHKITIEPTASGLYYIEKNAGTGISPESTDFVLVNTTWTLVDGSVAGTNDTAYARKKNILPFVSYKGPIKYYLPYCFKGLNEGLKMMKEGGKAQLIVPSKIGLDGVATLYVPKYSTLIINLELLRVIKDPIADDHKFIVQWLDSLQIQESDSIEGIYMKVDSDGTGDPFEYGDTVKLQYKERSLDTIYSIGPVKFLDANYIVDVGDILPGLKVAIEHLKVGSVAKVILPYKMAFGPNGRINNYAIVDVPSYTSFYYQLIIKGVGRSQTK